MRIIAGKFRGRRLFSAKTPALRPISDRIKQSLFDMITGLCPGAAFLDLYAGTGAVGLEALSRGARLACFVERQKDCLEAIRRNLRDLGLEGSAKVLQGSARGDLSWITYRSGVAQYDLVFMGPPYKETPATSRGIEPPEEELVRERPKMLALSNETALGVAQAELLAPKGLLIGQHHVKEPFGAPEGYELFRREKYGDSYLSFVRRLI